jgi:low temperature requirement protein LtrA
MTEGGLLRDRSPGNGEPAQRVTNPATRSSRSAAASSWWRRCAARCGGTSSGSSPGAQVSGLLAVARTSDWTIEGGHFAERCQGFILITLGESIVIIGATLSGIAHITGAEVAAFAVAFASSAALWWLYFDRAAAASARVIAASSDPGRLGRSAYHLIHPVMVAGIIVTAAGDEKILSLPSSAATAASAEMILGGPALFLAGHAAFKFVVWRVIP